MKKDMNNTEKYMDQDWEKIASMISGETQQDSETMRQFRDEDPFETEKKWNLMREMGKENSINVEKAWKNLYSRLEENGLLAEEDKKYRFFRSPLLKIAAGILIVAGLGAAFLYLGSRNATGFDTVIATSQIERNTEVTLPDGSKVSLNRNSSLSFNKDPEKFKRAVALKGEAFFDVTPDPSNPFTINAGNGKVKVLGTSFNVLTSNSGNSVEVFVKTGKVLLSNNSGSQNLTLEPGFVGTVNENTSRKYINNNPNYLAWNTGLFVFENQKLKVVFTDLKKVFNIDIVADNPEILDKTITTTFEKEQEELIIQVICSTFSLNYRKEGAVYHLSGR
jgi:transmembrane sensor